MTYTDVFGGSPVQPADVSFRAISLDSDLTLSWPIVGADTDNVVARIMDVTPDQAGRTITMPPADEVSTGQDALFNNVGAYAFTLLNSAGGTITSVPAGTSYYVYVRTNATAAGTWGSVLYGGTASTANAGALAGLGTVAVGQILGTGYETVTTAADYTIAVTDRAKLFTWTGGVGTFALPSVVDAGNNFFVAVGNQGTGQITIDPSSSETIDGASTLVLNPEESAFVVCSGTEWFTIGRGRSVNFVTTLLNKDISGSGDVTLTGAEAANVIQVYSGTLTGARAVIVPSAVQVYYVTNNTTGAYNLTIKTAAGSGVIVSTNEKAIVYCNGTDVVDADTATPISNAAIADGNAGSPGLQFANETNTGLYRAGAGQFAVSVLGSQRAQWTSAGYAVTGTFSASGAATLSSTLAVGGAVTMSTTLAVTGAATFGSTVGITGTLSVPTIGTASGALTLSPTTVIQAAKAAQAQVVTLTDGATITPDFAAGNTFKVTLGGSRVLANPINLAVGQGGIIRVAQDATGGRTLSYGSYYKFSGTNVLSVAANSIDVIAYQVVNTNEILCVLVRGFT